MAPARVSRLLRAMGGRLAEAGLTVWLLGTAVFLALRLLPGDPAAVVLGDLADEASRVALRSKLGLDRSLLRQYGAFLFGCLSLDFGPSLYEPTSSALRRVTRALPPTITLAAGAVLLGSLAGLSAAVLSRGPWLGYGWLRRSFPVAIVVIAATPLLALAPVVTYVFAVRYPWLPLPGDPAAPWRGQAFATVLLALPLGAQVARIAQAALADVERASFLTVARAKGAGPARVWILHALPTVASPVLTVIAAQLGALLGGAVVLERLFERPGLGTLLLESYAARDLPVLEASSYVAGALFVTTQLLATTLHASFDPRVAHGDSPLAIRSPCASL